VPDEDAILRSISAIACQMMEETASRRQALPLQSEDPFYCSMNSAQINLEEVYLFLKTAYKVAQWSPECNIYALVLVTRMHHHGFPLTWRNWNRIFIVAMLIAQKMWDDVPLTNLDFPQLWSMCAPHSSPFTAVQLSHMEFTFIKLIKWEAHVTREVYTQFYYELGALAQDVKLSGFASRAQTDEQLVALEVTTQKNNPSSHVMHHVFNEEREACLKRPTTGEMPLRSLANRSIKILS
jgi:hypothetical protein